MSVLERLARAGHRAAIAVWDAWNPGQARDERGRCGEGNSSQTAQEAEAKSSAASKASGEARRSGLNKDGFTSKPGVSPETAKLHADAAKAHHEAARSAVSGSKMEKFHKQEAAKHEGQSTPLTHVEQMEKFRSQMSVAVKMDRTHNMAGAVAATPPSAMAGKPFTSARERRDAAEARSNDPRTTSSHEQDKMEARQLASGDRVPLKQGPTQSGGYKGNPAAEGNRAVREDDRARMSGGSRHEQAKAIREKAMKASSYEETARLLKEAKMVERGRFNAGPSDPVHGGSGRGAPYNRDVKKELSPANQRAVERLNNAMKAQELEGAAARHEFMGRSKEAASARAEASQARVDKDPVHGGGGKSDDLSRSAHRLDDKASLIQDHGRAVVAYREAAKAHLEAAQSMSPSHPQYSNHMGGHYTSLNQARKLETEMRQGKKK